MCGSQVKTRAKAGQLSKCNLSKYNFLLGFNARPAPPLLYWTKRVKGFQDAAQLLYSRTVLFHNVDRQRLPMPHSTMSFWHLLIRYQVGMLRNMYVCLYVCMSVCLYVCMSTCTCTCMCICICICIETLCCMCVKHCKRSKPVESWALNFNRSLSANSYDATLPIDFGRTGNPSPRVCLLLRLVPWPSECWSHHPPGEMQCLRYAQHKHTCKTPLGLALVVLKYSMFKVFETACWATADTSNETHTQHCQWQW